MKYLTNNLNILYLYLLKMGASSSVDEAQFKSLQNTVNSQASKINALSGLEKQISDVNKAAASGIEYSKLAEAINKETNYRQNLAVAIAQNPNDLGKNLADEIGKSNSIIENLNSKLAASTTLQDKVADTLSSNDKYKERIRGPKGADGSIGDQAALKSNLFDTGYTMWCADGEFCKIPDKKKGGEIGGIRFSDKFSSYPNEQRNGKWTSEISNDTDVDKKLMIVGNKSGGGARRVGIWDELQVHGEFGVDKETKLKGDVTIGNKNKWILHTPGDKPALHIAPWDNNEWDWGAQVKILPKRLDIGEWSLRANDNHLRFFHKGDEIIVFHNKSHGNGEITANNFWAQSNSSRHGRV
jgi:hypothetical protein